jgi:undecaprenyl-phosphate 4-deoxy-4-formamido-L-arabinose transferase
MATETSLALSLVIPVYGSELVLPELVSRLQDTLDSLPAIRGSYEAIFVCDCSPDRSWQVLTELSAQHPGCAASTCA